jgi:hypothetical protein
MKACSSSFWVGSRQTPAPAGLALLLQSCAAVLLPTAILAAPVAFHVQVEPPEATNWITPALF